MEIKEIIDSPLKLLLLSKFIGGNTIDNINNFNGWEQVLGVNPGNFINQLLDSGILVTADLEDHLSIKCTREELSGLLKKRGLPVSGLKGILSKRLVKADPDGMRSLVVGLKVYKCSEEAKSIADCYLTDEKENDLLFENKIICFLNDNKIREALLLKKDNELRKVFPQPKLFYFQEYNYNDSIASWSNYDPKDDLERLEFTIKARPKILSSLNEGQMRQVCFVAALSFFMDNRKFIKALPDELNNVPHIDKATAVNLVISYVYQMYKLEQWRKDKNLNIKYVEIRPIKDDSSCEVCKSLYGKIFNIKDVPEIPHKDCTSICGCRCVLLAKFQ